MKLACGVDIVDLTRMERLLAKHKQALVQRILSPIEQERLRMCPKPKQTTTFAGMFAAKEAVAKAFGTGLWTSGISWADIVVDKNISGKPKIILTGELAELANERKVGNIDISISHDGGNVVAFCILVEGMEDVRAE